MYELYLAGFFNIFGIVYIFLFIVTVPVLVHVAIDCIKYKETLKESVLSENRFLSELFAKKPFLSLLVLLLSAILCVFQNSNVHRLIAGDNIYYRSSGTYCYTVLLERGSSKLYCQGEIGISSEVDVEDTRDDRTKYALHRDYIVGKVYIDKTRYIEFNTDYGEIVPEKQEDVEDVSGKTWYLTLLNHPAYHPEIYETPPKYNAVDTAFTLLMLFSILFQIYALVLEYARQQFLKTQKNDLTTALSAEIPEVLKQPIPRMSANTFTVILIAFLICGGLILALYDENKSIKQKLDKVNQELESSEMSKNAYSSLYHNLESDYNDLSDDYDSLQTDYDNLENYLYY